MPRTAATGKEDLAQVFLQIRCVLFAEVCHHPFPRALFRSLILILSIDSTLTRVTTGALGFVASPGPFRFLSFVPGMIARVHIGRTCSSSGIRGWGRRKYDDNPSALAEYHSLYIAFSAHTPSLWKARRAATYNGVPCAAGISLLSMICKSTWKPSPIGRPKSLDH